MGDVNKLLEMITVSERKTGIMTQEIEKMEEELMKLEIESNSLKLKKTETDQELKFKRKVVEEKNIDVSLVKNQCQLWKDIEEEKKVLLANEQLNLESIQQKVCEIRIEFAEDINKFLNENDLLLLGKNKIQQAIKILEDKQQLEEEIKILENEVTSKESEIVKMKSDFHNKLETLQNEKSVLELESENVIKQNKDLEGKTAKSQESKLNDECCCEMPKNEICQREMLGQIKFHEINYETNYHSDVFCKFEGLEETDEEEDEQLYSEDEEVEESKHITSNNTFSFKCNGTSTTTGTTKTRQNQKRQKCQGFIPIAPGSLKRTNDNRQQPFTQRKKNS